MKSTAPIGIFDSGYGGLTVLKEIENQLPQYDYLYLGDNARAPYGSRSFDTVYEYTLECVEWFFKQGCHLVILACNTASAKALRNIQIKDLHRIGPGKRVLGVIRPTVEIIGTLSKSKSIGILGTAGTVKSNSYPMEMEKFFPDIKVYQQACPMWVPLIENNEHETEGADYFVSKYISQLLVQSPSIDTVLLACTHYPLLLDKISQFMSTSINVMSQGKIVADSLKNYLKRHPEIDEKCSKNANTAFFTTDSNEDFDNHAASFYGKSIKSTHLRL